MKKFITSFLVILLIAAMGFMGMRWTTREMATQAREFNEKIALLQKQIAGLGDKLAEISKTPTVASAVTFPRQEIVNRQTVRQQSQEEMLTSAVARTTPAVVSIVISKDVPELEVVYVNPFGDDPFFRDFGARVPQYRQKGTVHKKVGGGTGFIVDSRGYILTNKHVVEDASASYTVLLADGKQLPATVVYKDNTKDIAVIKVEAGGLPAVSLGDSSTLKLGQTVIAIGNALAEYNNSVSVGIISGLNRSIEAVTGKGQEQLQGVIQTDAAINPGNSGGPLLDLQGKVVGVNVATVVGASSISFSIPINDARKIIESVVR